MLHFLTRIPLTRALPPRLTGPLLPTTARALTRTLRPGIRAFHSPPARLNQRPSPEHTQARPPNSNGTLSQRLKHLIRTYGWYALGVNLTVSALDFTVAFAGVNLLGPEYVSGVTNSVKETIARVLHSRPPEPSRDETDASYLAIIRRFGGSGDLFTKLALAFAVHKTLFFPVRMGLTIALTPRLVSWLTRRGWAGSEGTKRAAQAMRERIRERGRSGD